MQVKTSIKRSVHLPVWLALGLVSFAIYLLTLPADLRNNADTVDRFFVTRSLIHGHLSVACGVVKNTDTRLAFGRHHCLYAIYGPGQSVLMMPLYLIGKAVAAASGASESFLIALAVRSLDPILGAIAIVLFFLLASNLGYSRRAAICISLILAFATSVWPDVQSGQEQTQVTLALLAAVYAAIKTVEAARTRAAGGRPTPMLGMEPVQGWALLCGAAAGFGIFTRYDFLIPAAVVFIFLVQSLSRAGEGRKESAARGFGRKAAVSFGAGFLPFLLAVAVWNTARFGSPVRVGEAVSSPFGFPIWQGIPNLLVSPGKGLIWYVPALWLLPFVAAPFLRRSRPFFWLSVALVVTAVVFYANVVYWHGDPAWGPRYLFPVVPFLVLPLGELFERWPSRPTLLKGASVGILGLSLVLQLASVGADPWRFWYHLVQQRQAAGQTWVWSPSKYNYYWNVSDSPELYQFVNVTDVLQIGFGDRKPVIPPAPACRSDRLNPGQLGGVSCRPLNSVSPIWLNDRYQWITPNPVPLSLAARIAIIAILLVTALLGHGVADRGAIFPTSEQSPSIAGRYEI